MNRMKSLAMLAAMIGAAGSPYFSERTPRNPRARENRENQQQRLMGRNRRHEPTSVFNIHGEQIEARSRKDALKIYNHRHKI